jgi:hypothetical protein
MELVSANINKFHMDGTDPKTRTTETLDRLTLNVTKLFKA